MGIRTHQQILVVTRVLVMAVRRYSCPKMGFIMGCEICELAGYTMPIKVVRFPSNLS